MIRLDHVYKGFNGNAVLEDISLALPEKGFCAITGRSGRGKTTLLYLIAGLYKPDRGSIQRNGETISMVFQEDRLLPWETAAQNDAIASTREIAAKLLTELGLGAELDKYPKELSGGMRRRVAIARALAVGAPLVIMDEPFSGLDTENHSAAAGVILEYTAGSTLIVVTHDTGDAELLGAGLELVVGDFLGFDHGCSCV